MEILWQPLTKVLDHRYTILTIRLFAMHKRILDMSKRENCSLATSWNISKCNIHLIIVFDIYCLQYLYFFKIIDQSEEKKKKENLTYFNEAINNTRLDSPLVGLFRDNETNNINGTKHG